jgi:hypothetical protein
MQKRLRIDAAGIPFQTRAYHAPRGTSTAGMWIECRMEMAGASPHLRPLAVPPTPHEYATGGGMAQGNFKASSRCATPAAPHGQEAAGILSAP